MAVLAFWSTLQSFSGAILAPLQIGLGPQSGKGVEGAVSVPSGCDFFWA